MQGSLDTEAMCSDGEASAANAPTLFTGVLTSVLVVGLTALHVGRDAVDEKIRGAIDRYFGVDTAEVDAQVMAARRAAWWSGTALPARHRGTATGAAAP